MITANTDELLKSLELAKLEITRRLKQMVVGFATNVAVSASNNTPVGNQIDIDRPGRYRTYYEQRLTDYGLPMEAGYHQGAWQYSENGDFVMYRDITSQSAMQNDVENEAEASYKLGDKIYIGAEGPGYEMLLPRIDQPATDAIVSAYQSNIQRHYQKQ